MSAPAPTISEAAAARESADEAISKFSETQKRLDDLTEQLKSISAQVGQVTRERDAAQSKLESTNAELAKAKESAEQANTKATELENAANSSKEAETERSKLLQAALDQADAEIERLKTELEQQKANPPEQGDLVSPPPGE